MTLAQILAGVYALAGDVTDQSDYTVIARINRAQKLLAARVRSDVPHLAITQWQTDLTSVSTTYTLPADFQSERAVRILGALADRLTEDDEPDAFSGPWYRIIGGSILVSEAVTSAVPDGLFVEYQTRMDTPLALSTDVSALPPELHDFIVAMAASFLANHDGITAAMASEDIHYRAWARSRQPAIRQLDGGGYG